METHRELSDYEFEQLFERCEFPPAMFSHEAHLRLAWIHIRKYGQSKAISNICTQLQTYVVKLGAEDKYNLTLTVAAIKAVYHFINKSASETFTAFITEFPRLNYNFKDLLAAHYGFDIYKSFAAKQQYLEPDLLPFT